LGLGLGLGSGLGCDALRLLDEVLLALLERDRVDDALALAALEAGLDDVELGGVDHERQLVRVRDGVRVRGRVSNIGFGLGLGLPYP